MFESPKASSPKAGRGGEKGEAHVSKRDMLTGEIADAPVCYHKQTVRPDGKGMPQWEFTGNCVERGAKRVSDAAVGCRGLLESQPRATYLYLDPLGPLSGSSLHLLLRD